MSGTQPRHSNYGLASLWSDNKALPELSKSEMLKHLAFQSWKSFLSAPITSLLTLVTISITLLVFSLFILFFENVRDVVAAAQNETTINLYLKENIEVSRIDALKEEIGKLDYVDSVKFKSKLAALEEFRSELNEQAVILDGLEENNPLPASFEIKIKADDDSEKNYELFASAYAKNESVEQLDYSRGLVTRLTELLSFFRYAGVFSIIFMLLITGFIITNTIKLALYSHREEIEIMKLVGATDGFVRAPYMIEGFFQGLLGGVFSIIACYFIYIVFQDLIAGNEILKVFLPNLRFMSFFSVMLVVFSGIIVGIGGSFLTVKRFISN